MTDSFISAKGAVLLFEEEETYATVVTPTRPIGIIESWNIDERKNVSTIYGQGSSTMLALCENEYDVTGSLTVTMQRPEILEYLIGAPVDAGSGPYTHTINAISEDIKSITLGIGLYDANAESMLIRQRIRGVRIKKCDFVCSENREIKLNIDWEGIEAVQDDTTMSAINMTENAFCAKTWKFKIDDAGGSPAHRATVTNATISFIRELAKATGNGDLVPLYKDVDKCAIKINGSEFFTNKNIYDDFKGSSSELGVSQTAKKIEIEITNGLTGTSLRSLVMTFDNCKKSDGFRISSPTGTSFVKTNFTYECFLTSIVATDNTENWNA